MTTKSHKTLTGNQLHEPKGADSATASQVYLSDGAGSGTWTDQVTGNFKITLHRYTTTGNNTWTKASGLIGVFYVLVGGGGCSRASGAASLAAGDTTFNGVTAGGGNDSGSNAGTGGTASSGDININGFTSGATDVSAWLCPPWMAGMLGQDANGLKMYGAGGFKGGTGMYQGGSGAVSMGWFATGALSATETVAVGAGGVENGTAGVQGIALIYDYITV